MLKLLFLIGILYAIFKIRKFMKQIGGSVNRGLSEMADHQIDDIMIQDPVCEIYFPRREGFHLNDNGKNLYFCSKECRDRYLMGKKNV
jgi:YHS domain-containing protein